MVKYGLAIAAVAIVVGMVIGNHLRARRGAGIDPESTQWKQAVSKARASLPLLRDLYSSAAQPILIKYALRNSFGEREHVWGELLELGDATLRVSLETPLLRGTPPGNPPFEVSLVEIEDWQLTLSDGNIRGGFTTQAEIAFAQAQGKRLPSHIAEMIGKFVDS